ncbi:MAG TPA: hypothetical protein VGP07_19350 [Polyangia bacterium]
MAFGFMVVSAPGCSSGSSTAGGNNTALCMQACMKEVPCEMAAGVTITVAECVAACTASLGTTTCSNQAAITSAATACLSITDCTMLDACAQNLPDCVPTGAGAGAGGNSGSGGTSGGGGASATGGTTGTATCSICDKAATCCAAEAVLAGSTTASTDCAGLSAAVCTQAATEQASVISECQQLISLGAQLGLAACK